MAFDIKTTGTIDILQGLGDVRNVANITYSKKDSILTFEIMGENGTTEEKFSVELADLMGCLSELVGDDVDNYF